MLSLVLSVKIIKRISKTAKLVTQKIKLVTTKRITQCTKLTTKINEWYYYY